MACKVVATVCMRLGERVPYGLNLTKFCSNFFAFEEVYTLAEVVRPRSIEAGGRGATGFEYIVTTAGQSGVIEPRWPVVDGETVTSGSVEFTAQAISNDSLAKRIDTSTWDSPDEITVDGATTVTSSGEQKTGSYFTANALLRSGIVTNTVTFTDGEEEKYQFKVSVR